MDCKENLKRELQAKRSEVSSCVVLCNRLSFYHLYSVGASISREDGATCQKGKRYGTTITKKRRGDTFCYIRAKHAERTGAGGIALFSAAASAAGTGVDPTARRSSNKTVGFEQIAIL